jgi:hypothetical protein
MNLYDQYLSLLQMFFHRQDTRTRRQEKLSDEMAVKEEDLLRDAA